MSELFTAPTQLLASRRQPAHRLTCGFSGRRRSPRDWRVEALDARTLLATLLAAPPVEAGPVSGPQAVLDPATAPELDLAALALAGGAVGRSSAAGYTITPVNGGAIVLTAERVNPQAMSAALLPPSRFAGVPAQDVSVYGQSVSFVATVSGTPVATGTVSFLDGSTLLGTLTLSGGAATFTTSTLAAGTHSITAHYSGDAFHFPSTSAPLIQTVTPAPLTVTADGASRLFGQASPSFTATFSGFVNGEGPGALGGTLGFSTSATAASPAGSYPITPAGLTSSNYAITYVSGSLTVAAPVLSATAATVGAMEGASLTAVVATFTSDDPYEGPSQFTATIDWGDGTTSPGTVGYDSQDEVFTVSGRHAYDEEGSYALGVAIADAGGSTASAASTAIVADAPLSATGTAFATVAGSAFRGVVATFTDANPNGVASEFTATIDWGDGTSSAGLVTLDPAHGVFTVVGANTYEVSGRYAVRVTIRDAGGSTTAAASLALISSEVITPTLTAVGVAIAATEGSGFSGPVGTFVDSDPTGRPEDFAVTIAWGDGASSAGSVAALGQGEYRVVGAHAYAESGRYTVAVEIVGTGGERATALSLAVVADVALEGSGGEPPVIVGPDPAAPPPPSDDPAANLPAPPPAVAPSIPAPPVIGVPFVPTATGFAATPPVPVPGPSAGPAAAISLAPRVVVPQAVPGQGSPSALPSGTGAGPAHGAVAPAVPTVQGARADEPAVPASRPRQAGNDAVAELLSGLVRAWLAAVDVAGDEAGAIAAVTGRGPAVAAATATAPVRVDGRGDRDFPRELLWRELDDLSREIDSAGLGPRFQQVFGATLVAYAGYVLLNSRSGFWLLSLLMARPLWKQFDPLQVLLAWEDERKPSPDGRGEDEETLQSMVGDDPRTVCESKGRKHVANQLRARQPHPESPARRARPGPPAGPRGRGRQRAKSPL